MLGNSIVAKMTSATVAGQNRKLSCFSIMRPELGVATLCMLRYRWNAHGRCDIEDRFTEEVSVPDHHGSFLFPTGVILKRGYYSTVLILHGYAAVLHLQFM